MAQAVERPTLDFGSDHNPRVMGSSLASGFVLSIEPAFKILSLSLSLSLCPFPLVLHSLSLSLSKRKKKPSYDNLYFCYDLWAFTSLLIIPPAPGLI